MTHSKIDFDHFDHDHFDHISPRYFFCFQPLVFSLEILANLVFFS